VLTFLIAAGPPSFMIWRAKLLAAPEQMVNLVFLVAGLPPAAGDTIVIGENHLYGP